MHSDRYYFYQHNRLAVVAENKFATRLLYANGQPVCQISGLNAQTHLLGSDRSGSVLAAITSSKSIRIRYTPYGSVPEAASPIVPGYNGEILDRSRAYLLGSGERAYGPDLMRFRSPDRASIFLPGNQNSYVYVTGDPINYFDPTGKRKVLIDNHVFQKHEPLKHHKQISYLDKLETSNRIAIPDVRARLKRNKQKLSYAQRKQNEYNKLEQELQAVSKEKDRLALKKKEQGLDHNEVLTYGRLLHTYSKLKGDFGRAKTQWPAPSKSRYNELAQLIEQDTILIGELESNSRWLDQEMTRLRWDHSDSDVPTDRHIYWVFGYD